MKKRSFGLEQSLGGIFSNFRTLQLGIWFKTQGSVSKNCCVGVVDVAVEKVKENSSTRGWYRLFGPTARQGVESD